MGVFYYLSIMILNIIYILALIKIIRDNYLIKKNIKQMAVQDSQIAAIVASLNTSLATLQNDLPALTGGVTAATLTSLQIFATNFEQLVSTLDAEANPPAPVATEQAPA